MQRARQIKTITVSAALAAGSTTDNLASSTWDASGYEEFVVRWAIGTAAASRVSLAVQSATSTTAGDFSTITGATAGSTTINTEIRVGVLRPTKRYMRATMNSTGANVTSACFVDCFAPRVSPTTNNSTHVSAEVYVVST